MISSSDTTTLLHLQSHLDDIIQGLTEHTKFDDIDDLFENIEDIIDTTIINTQYKTELERYLMDIYDTIDSHNDSVYAARDDIINMIGAVTVILCAPRLQFCA
jgi:hypothetical protein